MRFYLLSLAIGLGVSAGGTLFLLRHWKLQLGLDSGDLVRKGQREAVPRLGGIPILLGFLAAFSIMAFATGFGRGGGASPFGWEFLVCNLAIFAVGLWDDFSPLTGRSKFLLLLLVAIFAYSLGLQIERLSLPFVEGSIELGGLAFAATVLWLLALPNIMNLIDGMDGLAGGISLALVLTLGILGLLTGNSELTILCFGVGGALAGFLLFNLPPARIYLGDGGAYFIGFFVASSSLVTSNKGSVGASMLVVMMVLGLPILDTICAIVRRAVSGLPLFGGDAYHLHHQLLRLGISKKRLLVILYAVTLLLGSLGLSIFLSRGSTLPFVGVIFCLLVLVLFEVLGYFKRGSHLIHRFFRAHRSRKDVRYAFALQQVLEHDLERPEVEAPIA